MQGPESSGSGFFLSICPLIWSLLLDINIEEALNSVLKINLSRKCN
jgi:hypothetical protein